MRTLAGRLERVMVAAFVAVAFLEYLADDRQLAAIVYWTFGEVTADLIEATYGQAVAIHHLDGIPVVVPLLRG